jgi:hypothetical protein
MNEPRTFDMVLATLSESERATCVAQPQPDASGRWLVSFLTDDGNDLCGWYNVEGMPPADILGDPARLERIDQWHQDEAEAAELHFTTLEASDSKPEMSP